ncbi:unnamed protein product [Lactuca saligna]|uniref:Uncharacterized protein n=1 Tax=Lactuca saligna TaxID=75948 RepID=A0AA35V129_LACSI|nr:unnamed protein product [Lactuca saligna]
MVKTPPEVDAFSMTIKNNSTGERRGCHRQHQHFPRHQLLPLLMLPFSRINRGSKTFILFYTRTRETHSKPSSSSPFYERSSPINIPHNLLLLPISSLFSSRQRQRTEVLIPPSCVVDRLDQKKKEDDGSFKMNKTPALAPFTPSLDPPGSIKRPSGQLQLQRLPPFSFPKTQGFPEVVVASIPSFDLCVTAWNF